MSEGDRAGLLRRFLPGAQTFRRRHPYLVFVVRRTSAGLALLVVASLLVFVMTSVLPGDAASYTLGRHATPEALAEVRARLGLDRPVYEQYVDWAGGLLTGDLGTSLTNGQPVGNLIGFRIVNTLALGLVTMLLLVPLSLVLGTLAGIRAGRRTDQVVSGTSLALVAVPEYVVATVLTLVFVVRFGLLPPLALVPPGDSPFADLSLLMLPVLTLLIAGVPWMVRYVRVGVAEANSSEYAEMARLNGLPERRVVVRHVLPNALAPSVQAFALILVWLLSGVLIVETIFSYPGLGQGLVDAITNRDVTLVQSTAMLVAAVYIAVTIAADLLVVLLIPKLRTAQ